MKLFIVGCGGVGKFIAYNEYLFSLQEYETAGIIDDRLFGTEKKIGACPVIGTVAMLKTLNEPFAVVIGIADPFVKRALVKKITGDHVVFPTLVAHNAWISPKTIVGKGVIVYPGVAINYETVIEDHVLLNMNCAIGHNCLIQQYSSLSPGVSLAGGTIIEESVFLGINAATKQSVRVGANTTVGGLAMVTKDLPADVTAVGIPAVPIKKTGTFA